MKKIFGVMLTIIIAGTPYFVKADPCVYGDADFNSSACYASGGTPSYSSPGIPAPSNTCTAADYVSGACANSGSAGASSQSGTLAPSNTCTAADYVSGACANSGSSNSAQTSQINVRTAPSVQTSPSSGLSVSTKIQNPIKYDTFSDFVAAVTKTAVQILLPIVVLAFIYSGFLFVKAQGNDTELTNAKKILGYSTMGAFILLGAYGFAQIIGQTVSTITR